MRWPHLRKISRLESSSRRTDETAAMNLQGFIETDDSALIVLDYQGYGRSTDRSQELYKLTPTSNPATKSRRQVVGFAKTHHRQREVQMAKRCGVRHFRRSESACRDTTRASETGRCQASFQRCRGHLGTTARIT